MRIKSALVTLTCILIFSAEAISQKLAADTSFAPTLNGSVNAIKILGDGKILIAGDFSTVNGVSRIRLARLNGDGSLDTAFDANSTMTGPSGNAVILSMEVLSDGKILLGGIFGSGIPIEWTRGVVRLNSDGSFDSSLTSTIQIRNGFVKKAEQLPNGKILICGDFLQANGNNQPRLARYNSNGTYDSVFTTAINLDCNDIESQPDGKYLVSGYYSTLNGNPSSGLRRFNADDTVDTTFAAPASLGAFYRGIELQGDGSILTFSQNGTDAIASRLNSDGSLRSTFPTGLSVPRDFVSQANGKAIVVGEYRNVFGQSFDLNRFNTDGTHDPSLNRLSFYGSDTSDEPRSVAIAADGKVIVGGNFTSFTHFTGGPSINRPYLVRFNPEAIPIKPRYDFDGDGRDDMAVFRPSDQVWYLNRSTAGFFSTRFGISMDKPVVADYDDDGKADIAVFRDGTWYWLRSSDSAFAYGVAGQAGDIPSPMRNGGYNSVLVFFRPAAAKFYTQYPFQASPYEIEFRNMIMQSTDRPVIGDYDGDGKDDLAVFRDGNWFFMRSNNLETRHYQFGIAGDVPVVGDFDGDLRTDCAVFRPSNGSWYISKTTEGFTIVRWGLSSDVPAASDFDGDGKTDIAVFRPSDGNWYQYRSNGAVNIEHFGSTGDIPAQAR